MNPSPPSVEPAGPPRADREAGSPPIKAKASAIRPEIQALRAVAVALVVVYHLWPSVARGGFVGVDVFFAISGFLITSLLLREIDHTGTVSLREFWGRRARRILPAALFTLLVCAIATVVVVPLNHWPQYFDDLRASTTYVQNFHLAHNAVDYFAADNAPSPVQHFWSLSVEEQFYLGWPLMMACVLVPAARSSQHHKRLLIGLAMGVLTAWSVVHSLQLTAGNPSGAYFVTSTRAWEFGVGGLLAFWRRPDGGWDAARAGLSWAGLAAVAIAGLAYTTGTPFPGYAALLPVFGALAVIGAGTPKRRWAPNRLFALRPVQFTGDVSYAIYLWHWPLLILAPFVLGHAVRTLDTPVILMLTFLLAWLSKHLIEDPVRSGRLLVGRPLSYTFGAAIAATAVVMAVDLGATEHVDAQMRKDATIARRVLAATPRCFGAAARDTVRPCHNPSLARLVVPSPVEAPKMRNLPCSSRSRFGLVYACGFGSATAHPTAQVALLGDSHASHWRAALDVVARRERWRGVSVTHTACPLSAALADIPQPGRSICPRWKTQALQWLRAHPEVTTVFVSNHTGGTVVDPGRPGQFAAQAAGYERIWAQMPASVTHVVVLRDTPKMRGGTLTCVQQAIDRRADAAEACAVPRATALQPDPAVVAAGRLRSPRIQTIDMTRFLCSTARCWPVIGGALVYKDVHHLTTVFASTLGPFVQRDVEHLAAGWSR